MFCTVCGNKLPDGAAFCPKCGSPMAPTPPQQGQTATEFFGAPRQPAQPVPPDPQFDPALDDGEETATEFFSQPPVAPQGGGQPVSGEPVSAPDPRFDPALDDGEETATEFFSQPPVAPQGGGQPASGEPAGGPDPRFDPALDDGEETATEFFSQPPVAPQGDGQPVSGEPAGGPDPRFDPTLDDGEESATEFFSQPPVAPQSGAQPEPDGGIAPQSAGGAGGQIPPQDTGEPGSALARAGAGGRISTIAQEGAGGEGRNTVQKTAKALSVGRRRPKLPVIIGLAAVLVAALGIGIFMLVRFFLAGGGSPVFYLQEEKLMYQSGAGKDPVPVMEGVSAAAVAATPDGKYAGLLLSDGYQITLCRVELGKLGKDLSKNLTQLQVAGTDLSEDYWIYLTGGEVSTLPTADGAENQMTIFAMGGDGALYYIDSMQELCRFGGSGAETLAQQVEAFRTSQDGSRILLRQPDDKLGLWSAEGVQEVTDEVIEVVYTDPELTQICYTQPGEEIGYDYTYDLYAWEGGNPRLLAERISGDIQMTSPDQFIYVALNPQEYRLSQFVQDDMASQDANITRPTYDDFRTTETYTDFFGNQRERTTTDYDAYQEAYDQYREKENRDWLRQHLEDETVQRDTYAIYLRQDGTDTLICDQVAGWDLLDQQVMVYQRYSDSADISPISISQVEDLWDVESYLEEMGMYEQTTVIADPSGERYEIAGDVGVCAVAEDGTLYVTQDEDLIRYTKAGGYSDPETVAQQVTQLSQAYGRIYYIRNSGDTFELGVAGEEGTLPTAGLSTYESTLFSYEDGTLYARTYKDRYEGDTLTWGAPGEDWYEITAGVQAVARLDDRLVIMTTDVRESSQGGYRLFSYEDGQLKVIANGVSGFCCPLAQQPVQIYP